MSINKVILVGNVGKDPVVRYFDKGVAKATFPLATSESYTNQQGETVTSTEWHNIVLWRALAEVAEKTVKKGTQVYVVGKIKTRSYTDKEGNNKYITEILADTIMVLEKKQGTYSGPQDAPSGDNRNKGIPSGELNNASPSNQNSDENSNGSWTGKNPDEPGPGGSPGRGPFAGNNDDDLPF
ncbi:MAG: single-stranded DNA-binding protein [Bacteroidales bacterium]|jgi:single-strand DNA-binding protein